MLTWLSSCVITNYNQKHPEIYFFKHVIMLFWCWQCKEVHTKTLCLFQTGACSIIMFSCASKHILHVCKYVLSSHACIGCVEVQLSLRTLALNNNEHKLIALTLFQFTQWIMKPATLIFILYSLTIIWPKLKTNIKQKHWVSGFL